jgi:hypothetical protein
MMQTTVENLQRVWEPPREDRSKRFASRLWRKPQFGVLGRLEYLSGHHRIFNPYGGGPMNGQCVRLEIARWILQHCGIARIVETGTYRGTTTAWFAQFALPVVTAEISPRYANFSRARLRRLSNVEVRRRDSVTVLAELARANIDRNAPTLFYLDAHWRDYIPLADELAILTAAFPRAVVMIDDFKVPGDAGYGYDDYGPGKTIDLDLLRSCHGVPERVFFPAVASRWETGGRRGCVVFSNDTALTKEIMRLSLLRSHALRDQP